MSKSVTNCVFLKIKSKDTYKELLSKGIISLKLDKVEGVKEKNFVRITVHSSQKMFDELTSFLNKIL